MRTRAGTREALANPRYDIELETKQVCSITDSPDGIQMNIDQDLEKIALQERRLQFKHFDSEMAWVLGTALKAAAEKRQVAVAIDIQLHGHPLFSYAMPGTTRDNLEWIRRKRNVVMRFHHSSYAIGLKQERDQATLQDKFGLDCACRLRP